MSHRCRALSMRWLPLALVASLLALGCGEMLSVGSHASLQVIRNVSVNQNMFANDNASRTQDVAKTDSLTFHGAGSARVEAGSFLQNQAEEGKAMRTSKEGGGATRARAILYNHGEAWSALHAHAEVGSRLQTHAEAGSGLQADAGAGSDMLTAVEGGSDMQTDAEEGSDMQTDTEGLGKAGGHGYGAGYADAANAAYDMKAAVGMFSKYKAGRRYKKRHKGRFKFHRGTATTTTTPSARIFPSVGMTISGRFLLKWEVHPRYFGHGAVLSPKDLKSAGKSSPEERLKTAQSSFSPTNAVSNYAQEVIAFISEDLKRHRKKVVVKLAVDCENVIVMGMLRDECQIMQSFMTRQDLDPVGAQRLMFCQESFVDIDTHSAGEEEFIVIDYGGIPLLDRGLRLTYYELTMVAKQLLQAVRYIALLNISHRDIRPANILVRRLKAPNNITTPVITLQDYTLYTKDPLCEDFQANCNMDFSEYWFAPPEFRSDTIRMLLHINYPTMEIYSYDAWSVAFTVMDIMCMAYDNPAQYGVHSEDQNESHNEICVNWASSCMYACGSSMSVAIEKVIASAMLIWPEKRGKIFEMIDMLCHYPTYIIVETHGTFLLALDQDSCGYRAYGYERFPNGERVDNNSPDQAPGDYLMKADNMTNVVIHAQTLDENFTLSTGPKIGSKLPPEELGFPSPEKPGGVPDTTDTMAAAVIKKKAFSVEEISGSSN